MLRNYWQAEIQGYYAIDSLEGRAQKKALDDKYIERSVSETSNGNVSKETLRKVLTEGECVLTGFPCALEYR